LKRAKPKTLTGSAQVRKSLNPETGGDGTKVERYGTNPKGIAFFDAGGRYIITVMRSDRAKYASNALRRGIWSAIGGACIA
jgi:hypothetical protein